MFIFVTAKTLGFCPLSGLVCDLLSRRQFHGSPKAHCQKSVLVKISTVTISTSTALRTPELLVAFSTRVGGHHCQCATFRVLGSQGDWYHKQLVQPKDACQPTNIVNCFAHLHGTCRVGPKLSRLQSFWDSFQWRKQLLRIFGPEFFRINSLIKTAQSTVLKNRAEHGVFFAASAANFLKTLH